MLTAAPRTPAPSATGLPPLQRSFDDLGTPLHQVTFCVFDVETTGASAASCALTEIGAVKVRGGEVVGTFHTLVNPGVPIPPQITVLTGITQAMVIPAPRPEEVLPAFMEFAAGCVLVGHNVRFDISFVKAGLAAMGWDPPPLRSLDTCALARRLVQEEVPNCRLGTLADRFRLPHQPSHRALDDAWATTDLLHLLLERAGSMGVLALDDLLALPTIKGHPEQAKLKLTAHLPRSPGVYLFRDRRGEVLYVGKAADLRSRVRQYFSGDTRRKVNQLIRETEHIDHRVTAGRLEAAVAEVRLIQELQPRFNRHGKAKKPAWVKLTLDEAFPRLSVVRGAKPGDGCCYVGPLASQAVAKRVVEAIHTAAPIRRCTSRVRPGGAPARSAMCAPAQLGVSRCPCSGELSPAEYEPVVRSVQRGLTTEPALLLDPLAQRMHDLALAERFEEAADVRDRAGSLAAALERQRRLDCLRGSGLVRLRTHDGEEAELVSGRLWRAWPTGSTPPLVVEPDPFPTGPLTAEAADELLVVWRWMADHADRTTITHCDGELALPSSPVPAFTPTKPQ